MSADSPGLSTGTLIDGARMYAAAADTVNEKLPNALHVLSHLLGGGDTKRRGAFLLFVLALGGCATAVGTIPADHNLQGSDESVVVGRVEMVGPDGQPWAPGPAFIVGRMSLTAEHESSGKTYAIGCDTRGWLSDFYVSLPAGRYRITTWESRLLGLYAEIQAWFEIVPQQVVYIGTLRFTGGEGLLSAHLGGWKVIDDSESTLRSFRERFPQLQQAVVKSLIRF